MSSSDRRAILALLAALPLAACGFAPAYGPNGPAKGLVGRVRVDDPQDKYAFDLVERLEERLGRTRQPALLLSYEIVTRQQGQAITPDNAITRYQVFGTVTYTLKDAATNAELAAGTVQGFTAYSAIGTRVESDASEVDSKLRLMRILADRIVTQLLATSAAWNSK
jgi:LPS-assembly lipoprotein